MPPQPQPRHPNTLPHIIAWLSLFFLSCPPFPIPLTEKHTIAITRGHQTKITYSVKTNTTDPVSPHVSKHGPID